MLHVHPEPSEVRRQQPRGALAAQYGERYCGAGTVVSASKPWWLRGVEAVDNVAGPLLDDLVRHDAFAVGITIVGRGRRAVGVRAERLSRHILHGLNLPTATDQNRLLIQVAAVEHRVRELSKELQDAHAVAEEV